MFLYDRKKQKQPFENKKTIIKLDFDYNNGEKKTGQEKFSNFKTDYFKNNGRSSETLLNTFK